MADAIFWRADLDFWLRTLEPDILWSRDDCCLEYLDQSRNEIEFCDPRTGVLERAIEITKVADSHDA